MRSTVHPSDDLLEQIARLVDLSCAGRVDHTAAFVEACRRPARDEVTLGIRTFDDHPTDALADLVAPPSWWAFVLCTTGRAHFLDERDRAARADPRAPSPARATATRCPSCVGATRSRRLHGPGRGTRPRPRAGDPRVTVGRPAHGARADRVPDVVLRRMPPCADRSHDARARGLARSARHASWRCAMRTTGDARVHRGRPPCRRRAPRGGPHRVVALVDHGHRQGRRAGDRRHLGVRRPPRASCSSTARAWPCDRCSRGTPPAPRSPGCGPPSAPSAGPAGRARSPTPPPRSPASAWLRRTDPATYAEIGTVLLPHDWLTYRLAGRTVTDRGSASSTGRVVTARRAVDPRGRRPAGRPRRARGLGGAAPEVLDPAEQADWLDAPVFEMLGLRGRPIVAPGTGAAMAVALALDLGPGRIGRGPRRAHHRAGPARRADRRPLGHRAQPRGCHWPAPRRRLRRRAARRSVASMAELLDLHLSEFGLAALRAEPTAEIVVVPGVPDRAGRGRHRPRRRGRARRAGPGHLRGRGRRRAGHGRRRDRRRGPVVRRRAAAPHRPRGQPRGAGPGAGHAGRSPRGGHARARWPPPEPACRPPPSCTACLPDDVAPRLGARRRAAGRPRGRPRARPPPGRARRGARPPEPRLGSVGHERHGAGRQPSAPSAWRAAMRSSS